MKGEVGTSIFYFNFNFQTKYKKLLQEDLDKSTINFRIYNFKKITTQLSL